MSVIFLDSASCSNGHGCGELAMKIAEELAVGSAWVAVAITQTLETNAGTHAFCKNR